MTQLSLFETPQLIGLGDRARVGNDTAGAILVDHGFVRVAYADGVREAALTLNPMVGAHQLLLSEVIDEFGFEGVKETPFGPEVRRLLQRLGTEVGRQMISESIWTDLAERKIRTLMAQGHSVVVTDCRFDNEAHHIHSLGGQMWRLNRLGVAIEGSHASESGISNHLVDAEVSNNGTISDLSMTILALTDLPHAA